MPYVDVDVLQETATHVQPVMKEFTPRYNMAHSQDVVEGVVKRLSKVNYDFDRFLDIALAALEQREDDYMKIVRERPKEEIRDYAAAYGALQDFFLDGYYDDLLGQVFMRLHPRRDNGVGYFPTPFNVCLMMAKMCDPKPTDTFCDPCVGSGAFPLAVKYIIHEKYGWQQSCLYVPKMFCVDIGATQIKMCKVQMYLSNYLYIIGLFSSVALKGGKP